MIGILPCAGEASRLYGLPKYLLPVPGGYLLERHVNAMKNSGCGTVLIGCNEGNYDMITDYSHYGLSYVASEHATMAQTVLSSRMGASALLNDRLANETVLFGMPDTYWTDFENGYYIGDKLHTGDDIEVVLMCWQVRWKQWQRGGMCDIEIGGRVTRIVDKPEKSESPWIWGAMRWKPSFWKWIKPEDKHVGISVQRAIENGVHVHACVSWNGDYFDCGTSEEYFEMIRTITA